MMSLKATKLLRRLNDGEKTTASEVTDVLLDEVAQWPAVTSMYEKTPSIDTEDHARAWIKDLLGRGDGPRAQAIRLLEGIKEDYDAENQRIDEFMLRMLVDTESLRYFLYCLPMWFAHHNPDVPVKDVLAEFKPTTTCYSILDRYNYEHADGLITCHPLDMAATWVMDERYGGRDNWRSDKYDELKTVTCGEAWKHLQTCMTQISTGDYFADYLKKSKLPGVPWLFEVNYEELFVPKEKEALQ